MVKIVEMEKIAPPHGSSTEVSFPLTFFDIFWLKVEPAQSLFFYHSNELFFDSILPRLKNSLSLTLKHFLPLAGKLIWSESSPKPFVKYVQGDAVSLTIAESDDDFNYLCGNNLREAERFSVLVPHLPVSQETAAVSSIQITLFPNCGFCVGVSTHHAVLDGRSAISFIKSWAHVCRLACFPMEVTPIYDRSVMKYPAELDEIYTNLHLEGPSTTRSLLTLESQIPQDSFRGTFVMTREAIEKLRQLVNNEMAKKNQQQQAIHVSSFSLTCAHAWLCLVKAQDVSEKKVFLIINADCRSRFEPPVASTYFGNCVRGVAAAAETKMLLGKEGFVVAVNAISEAIKSLDNGVLTEAENWDSWIGTWLSEGKVYAIGGSPRFELYGSDFGWGRPIKAELISIDKTGAISLQDHRDGIGAIQIDLVSKKHHMEAFTSLFAQGIQRCL